LREIRSQIVAWARVYALTAVLSLLHEILSGSVDWYVVIHFAGPFSLLEKINTEFKK
jgi:hypothetical protein